MKDEVATRLDPTVQGTIVSEILRKAEQYSARA